MTLIDIQDGGLARNDKYDVTVGVIDLVVTRGGADTETIRGYCRPDKKAEYINIIKKEIVWKQEYDCHSAKAGIQDNARTQAERA